MAPAKVIEKLLLRECIPRESSQKYESCIICSSNVVWRVASLFPESFIVSNAAAQVFPNLATIYYAVNNLNVSLVAVVGATSINLEDLLKLPSNSAEFEFKLLKKTYEENGEMILSMFDNQTLINSALMEINIDNQIEKLLSIKEFRKKVDENQLAICGFILDENGIYGDKTGFYLINLNGVKDPDDIKSEEILSNLSESLKKQKIKRILVQF